jgi:hypothetical protein
MKGPKWQFAVVWALGIFFILFYSSFLFLTNWIFTVRLCVVNKNDGERPPPLTPTPNWERTTTTSGTTTHHHQHQHETRWDTSRAKVWFTYSLVYKSGYV